ncbi:MAG: Smr/MutS family protein [Sphingobacteriaceae bacterium]|nr:Smr/MutS family protein [Sphingobacteriaceae bacterium]
MKLRIGDIVRFLNEKGEGKVTRIKNATTVYVELSDGFEIPYPVKDLVPIHTTLILDKDTDNIEMSTEPGDADAIYFIIEPDHELELLVNEYRLFIYNASSFQMLYTYSIKEGEYYQTLKHGELGAYQKVLLKQVKLSFFKEFQYHKINCILFKNSHFKAQLPIAEILSINEQVLKTEKKIQHDEFKNPVYGFILKEEFYNTKEVLQTLNEEDIKRIAAIKEFKSSVSVSRSKKQYFKSLEKEVDLHIEELVKDTKGLSSYEKLNIQLERFEKELDQAIENNLKKIIFIHGVGSGRLKAEILQILKTTNGITFHDAPYKEFGFGATQVNIL